MFQLGYALTSDSEPSHILTPTLETFPSRLLGECMASEDSFPGTAIRGRSNSIAAAIDCWRLQVFEIADLIVNWVAIAIASTLTALKLV